VAHWNCRTDEMNAAAVDAWLADTYAARQDEAKAKAEGRAYTPPPRVLYSGCPGCGAALRVRSPETAACPTCEVPPCR
jgi:hypothetical protein